MLRTSKSECYKKQNDDIADEMMNKKNKCFNLDESIDDVTTLRITYFQSNQAYKS